MIYICKQCGEFEQAQLKVADMGKLRGEIPCKVSIIDNRISRFACPTCGGFVTVKMSKEVEERLFRKKGFGKP